MVDNTFNIEGRSTVSTTTLIRISSLKVKDAIGGSDNKATIEGNIKGILETIFTEPGTVTFEGTAVNIGSSEAILSTINLINESNNSSPSCITMSMDGLKVGDRLTPSQEQKFTIKVTNTCTGSSSKNNEFSLSYIPVNANEGTTTIDEQLSELRNQITALQQEISENNVLKAYPVGSIYMSTSSTNPESLFGGKWERYAKGKTLVSVNEEETEFNTVNKTGGEKTHTLTTSEMPSHDHRIYMYTNQDYTTNIPKYVAHYQYENWKNQSNQPFLWQETEMTGKNSMEIGFTSVRGASKEHNNLQPYITVYMWKRVS